MFYAKVINCVPAYSMKTAKLPAHAPAFSVIKYRFQIHGGNGFFPFLRKKYYYYFCLPVLKYRELELLTSQDSGPHLWITSRNHMNASKMKRHDLLKCILSLLVKLLPAYPLYCCHPSIFFWRMRQRCSLNSHKPQHTSGISSCKHQNLLSNKLKTPLSALKHQSFHLLRGE